MKAFIRRGIAVSGLVATLAAVPVFSQVQLFEQDLSGLRPYAGMKWNQSVTEAELGVEYNIEGRTTLGFAYNQPLSDTIKWDSSYTTDKPTAFILNPYVMFEFLEPGNLSNFSFAIKADMYWENLNKSEDNLNSFRRILIGGGPVFSLRLWTSDRMAVIPSGAYEFFYVNWKKDLLLAPIPPSTTVTRSNPSKGEGIAHDFIGSCSLYYKFNEFQGISFDPQLVLKIGEGRSTDELINLHFQIGYVWTM